jgi:mono/diheme cytochrome c family protein
MRGSWFFLVMILAVSTEVSASDALAHRAMAVLHKYCTSCHGPDLQRGGLRLDHAQAIARGGDSRQKLIGASRNDSALWTRVGIDKDMPPPDAKQPTDQERLLLRQWLEAGAKFPPAASAPHVERLAAEAREFFRSFCLSCHGQEFRTPGLSFSNYDTLLFAGDDRTTPVVVGATPEASLVWTKIANKSMPPEEHPVIPGDAEKAKIREWIAAGAPRWPKTKSTRPQVAEEMVQTAIRGHLQELPASAGRHQRYFTFAHLHNNPSIADEELALFKAALSKLLNSLTWEADIVVPRPVPDTHETVYAVDLRDLGWTEQNHWNRLFADHPRANDEMHIGYPYGLTHSGDGRLTRVGEDIFRLTGSRLPKLRVRADWFIAKASRPPLYHELLELPDDAESLEARLGVDTQADFLLPDLLRGGVNRSGISLSNRLLDRHRALFGAYWISYDFASSSGKANLAQNPLGPVFPDNPFADFAFVHHGGEILFTLPNGMNGYLLVDERKRRIAQGPVEIVRDVNETAGTTKVVNGLSCMWCHKRGVVYFKDTLRGQHQFTGRELDKIEDLFTPVDRMNDRLARDEARFLRSLLETVQPFLPVTSIEQLRNMPDEPIGFAARYYQSDLPLERVVAELDLPAEEVLLLKSLIQRDSDVNDLLAPLLAPGGVIARERLESRRAGVSGFQAISEKLRIGIPFNVNVR